MIDNKQVVVDQVVEALKKIALNVPDEMQMSIAEVISLLAMNGFTQEEISNVELLINDIIEQYLGGSLISPNIPRSNSNLN